jgi:hypothetical protein
MVECPEHRGRLLVFLLSPSAAFKAMSMSQSGPANQPLPPIEFSSYDQLILVAVAVLEQAVDLVENSLTEDSQLSSSSVLLPGSTIGNRAT